MKSVSEAFLRNRILSDFEKALSTTDYDERQGLMDIVVVGGGPTGVEGLRRTGGNGAMSFPKIIRN